METLNLDATLQPGVTTTAKALRSGSDAIQKPDNEVPTWTVPDRRFISDVVPAPIIRVGSGLALLVLCLVIAFQYALNGVLTRIRAFANGGLVVIDDVDSIVDGLDRLSLSQRFFLSTDDVHFSQDVAESVIGIDKHVDSLRRFVVKPGHLRDAVIQLSGAVERALNSLRRSSDLKQSAGSAAALALLDDDVSIDDARTQAEQVRRLAAEDLFDRVRAEHRMVIFDLLF